MSCSARVLVVIAAVLSASAASSAQTRTWVKSHDRIFLADRVVAEWTLIATADKQVPRKSRRLYRSADGARLVIRFELENPGAPGVFSYTHPETGETLAVSVAGTSSTFTMAGRELVIPRVECEAYSGAAGNRCPPSVDSAARAFIGNASRSFRDALREFVGVAGSWSTAAFLEAGHVGFLFPDDPRPTSPPLDRTEGPSRVVPRFDPATSPPDEFDALFGAAYFE